MKKLLIVLFSLMAACKLPPSPEKYFDAAALNANLVSHFGSDYFITALGYSKRGSNQFNYEQQVNYAIQRVEANLKGVNDLLPTKETKAMLEASKDLFQFTLDSYRTDHLAVAKLIDSKAPKEEIAKAMEELDKKSYETFLIKYDKLYNIGTKYAKDHDIQLVETPKFNR